MSIVIVAYYKDAKKNPKYEHKITEQRFDVNYLRDKNKRSCKLSV